MDLKMISKLFSFIMLALCFQVHSASFDCSKAQSKLEKFICANPAISEADKRMGDAFLEARKRLRLKDT